MAANPGVITKLVNALGDKIPAIVKKHPALTAGTAGLAIGAMDRRGAAHRVESDLMREYTGAPGAKYSSCSSLEKFAEHKVGLASKISFEKVAMGDNEMFEGSSDVRSGMASGAERALGSNIVTQGINAIRRLLGFTAQTVKDKMVDEPKRKQIMQGILAQDPIVSRAEQEMPGQIQGAYGTMRRFAPALSTDPNAVTSFLRNAAMTGGPLDYQVIKGLADAESAVQRAQNEGAWLRGGF